MGQVSILPASEKGGSSLSAKNHPFPYLILPLVKVSHELCCVWTVVALRAEAQEESGGETHFLPDDDEDDHVHQNRKSKVFLLLLLLRLDDGPLCKSPSGNEEPVFLLGLSAGGQTGEAIAQLQGRPTQLSESDRVGTHAQEIKNYNRDSHTKKTPPPPPFSLEDSPILLQTGDESELRPTQLLVQPLLGRGTS